jgi:FtsP/CotA-like multicopper oxidase with cupredoxin domain
MQRALAAGVVAGLVGLTCACAPASPAQQSSTTASAGNGKTRVYYVAADEVTWDFAPTGTNRVTGGPFNQDAAFFMMPGPLSLGHVYKKTLFREYTDDTFTTLKPRPAEWEHLGMIGPVIRAEVGDTIKVVFKNNGHHRFSMHPHGVFYNKDSEGAEYEDGTGRKLGVDPGGTHTYEWPVPERAGPSHGEGSSVIWMYHSHIDEEKDVNAGLVGPLIVTARGMARPDGSPTDVDREIVAGFLEVDENLSWHIDENIKTYAIKGSKVVKTDNFADPVYVANLKETINGFSFGHTPGFTMNKGERVRWYLFATTNFEIHSPHWHGNTVVARHMRTDVTPLLPMDMVVADMQPDNPGTWLFHCHTGPHLRAGMVSMYTVADTAPKSAAQR